MSDQERRDNLHLAKKEIDEILGKRGVTLSSLEGGNHISVEDHVTENGETTKYFSLKLTNVPF